MIKIYCTAQNCENGDVLNPIPPFEVIGDCDNCNGTGHLFKVGDVYRIFYSKFNFRNSRIHIRGIVDYHYITYKSWSRRWGNWKYYTDYVRDFEYKAEYMKKIKC